MPSGDTFDFINQPILPNTYNRPNQINPQQSYQQQVQTPAYTAPPVQYNEPELSIGGFSFSTVDDNKSSNNKMVIKTEDVLEDSKSSKKKRSKKQLVESNSSEIIRGTGDKVEVLDTPTINTYF